MLTHFHVRLLCAIVSQVLGLPVGSAVKNPLPMQEMRIQSLDGEDPLKKEMATHSSFLAWKIPWTEEPGRLQSMGSQKSQIRLNTTTSNHQVLFQICVRKIYHKLSLESHWVKTCAIDKRNLASQTPITVSQ